MYMAELISMNFRLLILHKMKVLANCNQPDNLSGVVVQTSLQWLVLKNSGIDFLCCQFIGSV